MNSDFFDFILRRKSVRNYVPAAEISREVLEKICRAGLAAPSARNQQLREFIVVCERKTLDALVEFLPNAKFLKDASAAIVVCGILENPWSEYWQQACSACVEYMLLAAETFGLGACWCGLFPRQERASAAAKILGVSAAFMPMALLTIGVPEAGKDHGKDKWNAEKIHWEKF